MIQLIFIFFFNEVLMFLRLVFLVCLFTVVAKLFIFLLYFTLFLLFHFLFTFPFLHHLRHFSFAILLIQLG